MQYCSWSSVVFLMHAASWRYVNSERDMQLFCGACIALVSEINWAVGITDPKKKVQIGSYRLDADGNQGAKEIPLARSEIHLTEVLETICIQMYYYALTSGRQGERHYIRTASRDGTDISMKNVEATKEIRQDLEFACDTLLEESDDALIEMYKTNTYTDDEKISDRLCVEILNICTKKNVSDHMWAYASAVMAGMNEATDNRTRVAAEAAAQRRREKAEAAKKKAEAAAGGDVRGADDTGADDTGADDTGSVDEVINADNYDESDEVEIDEDGVERLRKKTEL